MPDKKMLAAKKAAKKADEYAALGPRSRSGRLVWSQSSAKLGGTAPPSDDGEHDGEDDDAQTDVILGNTALAPAAPKSAPRDTQRALAQRLADVRRHFPGALCADDLLSRVEHQLKTRYGFSGGNSIAVCNLCRDEATAVLRDRIEEAWGGAFTTSGLGGVLTCGVTGFKAGLSHAPICGTSGRERYVFFSFPHIAIDAAGHVGHIARPGRPDASHACGALLKVMGELEKEEQDEIKQAAATAMRVGGGNGGNADNANAPPASPSGKHPCASCGAEPPAAKQAAQPATLLVCNLDPEYSILKGRIDARLASSPAEKHAALSGGLVAVTKAAERAITADLERLVAAAVDPAKADYAVITGVEVHNWAVDLNDPAGASLEIIYPTQAYAVVNGKKVRLDLSSPAPAGFSISGSLTGAGAAGAKAAASSSPAKRGGVAGLAGKLAGLLRPGKAAAASADDGGDLNGSAATPRAIPTSVLQGRLAPV